jgi:hypothetical protein
MDSGLGMMWLFIVVVGALLIGGYIVYKKGA